MTQSSLESIPIIEKVLFCTQWGWRGGGLRSCDFSTRTVNINLTAGPKALVVFFSFTGLGSFVISSLLYQF